MGWDHLEILSKTTDREELKFTRKFSDIMSIQIFCIMVSRGQEWTQYLVKTMFACVNPQNQHPLLTGHTRRAALSRN
jgi:hypothetical protein